MSDEVKCAGTERDGFIITVGIRPLLIPGAGRQRGREAERRRGGEEERQRGGEEEREVGWLGWLAG